MLICFLGAPCSGKTTTAARLFAALKDGGVACEFVVEEARKYIARLRLINLPNSTTLTDYDQQEIMRYQSSSENLMIRSCGSEVIIVSDSSPLNALMYMSENTRKITKWWLEEHMKKVDLAFVCEPFNYNSNLDPNRVHNYQQSLDLQKQLPDLIKEFAPSLKVINLVGDSDLRFKEALAAVTEVQVDFNK